MSDYCKHDILRDRCWECLYKAAAMKAGQLHAEVARLRAAIVDLCQRVKACDEAGWTDDDATLTTEVIDLINTADAAMDEAK